mmetsp:Transcript_48770/g.119430  ORF Transcript_48770/g.119430 Transcript_48770/m.119430 type:complete len:237 (+) Transcript_48770:143-853(+)
MLRSNGPVAKERPPNCGQILLVGDFQSALKSVLEHNFSTLAEECNASSAVVGQKRLGVHCDCDCLSSLCRIVRCHLGQHGLDNSNVGLPTTNDDFVIAQCQKPLQYNIAQKLIVLFWRLGCYASNALVGLVVDLSQNFISGLEQGQAGRVQFLRSCYFLLHLNLLGLAVKLDANFLASRLHRGELANVKVLLRFDAYLIRLLVRLLANEGHHLLDLLLYLLVVHVARPAPAKILMR